MEGVGSITGSDEGNGSWAEKKYADGFHERLILCHGQIVKRLEVEYIDGWDIYRTFIIYVNEYLKLAWQVNCETERNWGRVGGWRAWVMVLDMLGVSLGRGICVRV